jgi:hypothetical protein
LLIYDDLAAAKLTVNSPAGEVRPLNVAPDLPLGVLVHEFAAAITKGTRKITSLALGVGVVDVLAALDQQVAGA